jgi:hypothetical protein
MDIWRLTVSSSCPTQRKERAPRQIQAESYPSLSSPVATAGLGAPNNCHLISARTSLDGKDLDLAAALKMVSTSHLQRLFPAYRASWPTTKTMIKMATTLSKRKVLFDTVEQMECPKFDISCLYRLCGEFLPLRGQTLIWRRERFTTHLCATP